MVASVPCPDPLRAGSVCPACALPLDTSFHSEGSRMCTLIPGCTPSHLPSAGVNTPPAAAVAPCEEARDPALKPRPTAGQGQVPGPGQEQVVLSEAVVWDIFFLFQSLKIQNVPKSFKKLPLPPAPPASCPHTQPAPQPVTSCSPRPRLTHPDLSTLARLPPLPSVTLAGLSGACTSPRDPWNRGQALSAQLQPGGGPWEDPCLEVEVGGWAEAFPRPLGWLASG